MQGCGLRFHYGTVGRGCYVSGNVSLSEGGLEHAEEVWTASKTSGSCQVYLFVIQKPNTKGVAPIYAI